MEVSGKLHALAASLPVIELMYPLDGSQSRSGPCGSEKNLFTPKGIEPDVPAFSPSVSWLGYLSFSVETVYEENYNLATKWVELLQTFRQNKIVRNRKKDATYWFVRELVELATVNMKENGKEEKWSY